MLPRSLPSFPKLSEVGKAQEHLSCEQDAANGEDAQNQKTTSHMLFNQPHTHTWCMHMTVTPVSLIHVVSSSGLAPLLL